MWQKIVCIIVFMCLFTGFSICFGSPQVVTTTEDLASIAGWVAGDKLSVTYLVPGKANVHSIELKPSYALKLRKADVVIRVGLGLDDWIFALIDNSRNKRLKQGELGHIDASEGCHVRDIPQQKITRLMGDVHPYGNPHYLLEPHNGVKVAETITRRFSLLFPEHTSYFEGRFLLFEETYTRKMEEWKPALAALNKVKVVTYHKMWGYFAAFTGIEPVGEIEPKPGIPPTAKHTRQVISLMMESGVSLIIRSPFYESRTAAMIAGKTNAQVITLAPQVGALPEATDYWSLFDTNITTLLKAVHNE